MICVDCGVNEEGNTGALQTMSEVILYDTRILDTCQYTFVQTHRIHNTRVNPKCKLWPLDDNDVPVLVHQS
jgi:hypothetical protein